MKRLYLLRHAKSSWADADLDDRDRPLARRGRRAAKAMGRQLAALDVRPELVLCSSARRARETLERVQRQLAASGAPRGSGGTDASQASHRSDAALPVAVEPGLYAGDASDLLRRIRAVPDSVETLMLVGHEPAMSQLAGGLAAPDRSEAWRKMRRKYPTGACAELCFRAGRWAEIAPGSGKLLRFLVPRDLA
jgi:phosphohistidine phosphatase